ncbi:MAG: hypothetical protein KME45_24155 [Stenomitos rutilans HA7619-LM2]|jgi:predicted DCC family thiol-disulfide oxidoreductase YuxK|nr:hypothetical protein [Stenomitos rutilans HA7619-LM2]
MKPKFNLPAFLAGFCFFILWSAIGPQISRAVFLLLDAPHVFPRAAIALLVSLLPLIVFLEVLMKLLFMNAIPDKIGYQPVELATVRGIDRDALTTYTIRLESLGFIKLLDFQLAKPSTGNARLFSHPKHHCFVEVGQLVGRTPMHCSVISVLDQGWRLGTTDRPLSSLSATAYAFFRQPRNLYRYQPSGDLNQLLQSHLELRQQLLADLQLQVIQDNSVQTFFEVEQRVRTQQKQALWRKSILVCLVEMLLFSLNPKDEWLGEYADLAARRR